MKSSSNHSSRLYDLLSSMRFAVSMLSVLGIASIIGTVLKQNEPYSNYIVEFGQFWFDLFNMLGLYDVYHSAWFLLILIFLVTSTSLCIYRNSPLMLREMRTFKESATEKSLRSFSHKHVFEVADVEESKQTIKDYLTLRDFKFKTVAYRDGSELVAAKIGSYQRLGYIFTHAAIVMICVGGLLDGNVPFKIQELLGYKQVETLDIPESQVPAKSRLSVANLSFRANMTLAEGTSSNVAFERMRDGYLVQELPFTVALKDFRIEHYATGQPKSFESDLVIMDPELGKPITQTISVNHPFIYKGIAIYQSDFQDGGTKMTFDRWNLFNAENAPVLSNGAIFDKTVLGSGDAALTIEFNDFRLFNILNLSADGKGKPHNVGPSVTYKVRDTEGQAREYVTYQQPLQVNGGYYFVSGMRETQQQDFRYLKIPADDNLTLNDFMRLKAVLFDKSAYPLIAKRLSENVMSDQAKPSAEMQTKFIESTSRLLEVFAKGGFTTIAQMIEKSVPEPEREKAAQTYIKIIQSAGFEAYKLSRERAEKKPIEMNAETQAFLLDSLNAISDLFYYGTPFYLQLKDFEHKEASGLQLTRSPGKNLVYLGSVLLVLGIFAMIYIRERRIWLLVKPEDQAILFAMSANRKNRDLDEEFERYRNELNEHLHRN